MILKLIVTIFIVLSLNSAHANGQIRFSGAIAESTYRTSDIGKSLTSINRISNTVRTASDIKNKMINIRVNYINKEKTSAITHITYITYK